MSEVFSFNEGSAYIYTGAGAQSALALFARNIALQTNNRWHKYRPPRSTTYVSTLVEQEATLSIGQLHSQLALIQIFESATAGVHVHLKHLVPSLNVSGGWRLFSGRLNNVGLGESDGGMNTVSLQGDFNVWSAY